MALKSQEKDEIDLIQMFNEIVVRRNSAKLTRTNWDGENFHLNCRPRLNYKGLNVNFAKNFRTAS